MKNQRIGFYGYLVLIALSLATAIVYIINSVRPYYEDFSIGLLIIILIAIVLAVGVTFYKPKDDRKVFKIITDVARIIVSILLIWAAATFIGARLESFGYIFGSDLELGNDEAFAAGSQAINLIILFVVTWIVSLVVSFFPIGEK